MTEAQLRHLSSVMRRLDEVLLEIESTIQSNRPEEIVIIHQNDVPFSRKPAILAEIERLRHELRRVNERYKLTIEAMSDRRKFAAKLALIAIELEGANSRYMAAYGVLNQEERAPLDSQIYRMVELVENLRSMMIAAPSC
jgi:hypothetical protein